MIQITDKKKCCGCNACADICPTGSIAFKADIEGFWYPEVNMDTCIDCHLCEKVCPIVEPAKQIKRYEEPIVFAAYTKDDVIRTDSTSGGIHSMLAQAMYKKNAYAGGAIYNEDHTVSHIVSNYPKMLDEIRSSKYLQSSMEGQYKEIKKLLQAGEEVFYCGCPCQVQALYKYIKKDYDNLTTCDFICRGVNSPKVFLKYMEMLERQYGARATRIKFKAKKWGGGITLLCALTLLTAKNIARTVGMTCSSLAIFRQVILHALHVMTAILKDSRKKQISLLLIFGVLKTLMRVWIRTEEPLSS